VTERPARAFQRFVVQLAGGGPGAKLARGTATAFTVSAAGTLIVFANQILLARVLGADAYGQYVYALTWVGLLVILSNAGFNTAAVRFVAKYRAAGQWGLLRGFQQRSVLIVFGVSTAVAVVSALLVLILRPRLGYDLAVVFWAACLLLPLWSMLEVYSAQLRGFKRILAARGPAQVLRPLLFAGGILGLHFMWSEGVGAPLAVLANITATIVSLGLTQLLLLGSLRPGADAIPEARPKEWLAVSLPLLLMSGLGIILRSTDTLMVGYFKGTTEAGVYAVASRAALLVPFMLTAVNTMAGPMISEYHAAGERRRLQRTLKVGAWAAFVFAIFVSAVLIGAGQPVLSVFGEEFMAGYAPMLILVGGQIFNCSTGSVGHLLTMTGYQNQAAAILGVAAAANIALNALLVPSFGALGAALATSASLVLWNAGMLAVVLRRLRLNPTILPVGARS
jgi:O-antigen/teichoic acid export membrane protein